MADEHQELEPDLEWMRRLVRDAVLIEGDPVRISDDLWAVHGHATYDGELILCEFASYAAASWVIGHTPPAAPQPGASCRSEGTRRF